MSNENAFKIDLLSKENDELKEKLYLSEVNIIINNIIAIIF